MTIIGSIAFDGYFFYCSNLETMNQIQKLWNLPERYFKLLTTEQLENDIILYRDQRVEIEEYSPFRLYFCSVCLTENQSNSQLFFECVLCKAHYMVHEDCIEDNSKCCFVCKKDFQDQRGHCCMCFLELGSNSHHLGKCETCQKNLWACGENCCKSTFEKKFLEYHICEKN